MGTSTQFIKNMMVSEIETKFTARYQRIFNRCASNGMTTTMKNNLEIIKNKFNSVMSEMLSIIDLNPESKLEQKMADYSHELSELSRLILSLWFHLNRWNLNEEKYPDFNRSIYDEINENKINAIIEYSMKNPELKGIKLNRDSIEILAVKNVGFDNEWSLVHKIGTKEFWIYIYNAKLNKLDLVPHKQIETDDPDKAKQIFRDEIKKEEEISQKTHHIETEKIMEKIHKNKDQ